MRAHGTKWLVPALVAAATAVVVAQGPQVKENAGATKVAVTGCVTRAASGAAAATGTAGTTAAASTPSYVLTKAAAAPVASASATEGKTVANQTKTPIASRYRLDGSGSMVGPYVDHQVQLTGTVTQPAAAKAGGKSPDAEAPILSVDSVLMLDQKCP